MPATFRIDEAYLVGAWCAAALWGNYIPSIGDVNAGLTVRAGVFSCFVTFALYQVVMLRARNQMTTSKYATTAAVLVLFVSTRLTCEVILNSEKQTWVVHNPHFFGTSSLDRWVHHQPRPFHIALFCQHWCQTQRSQRHGVHTQRTFCHYFAS